MNQNNNPNILDMLQELDEKIILSQRKNVVLLLGDTGTGKTTLAHFIAKDNTTLRSIKETAGQFLLEDDDGKISKKSTVSETIIPQLIEDINCLDLAIYDCPGFHDTRNTITDISNAYSIHKIMEHAENFKIVFVINYHSVKAGVDRHSFVELIQNASNIINNIGNFTDSIAAVITKVDNLFEENEDGSGLTLISDLDILIGIGKFLQDVRHEISTDRSYYQNAISLIDILLTKNDNNYKRIAIFRRPFKEGSLNGNISLQKCKNYIVKVFHDNIIFTKKGETEFGYTISDESKNEIFCLINDINMKICNTFNNVGKKIIDNYKLLENQISDLSEIIEKFVSAQSCVFKLKQKFIENKELKEIFDLLLQIFIDLNIEIPENISILQDYDKQLKFFNKISDNKLNIQSIEWKKGFDNLIGYLNDAKEWYMFLNIVYDQLSEYHIQKDTKKLNINILKDLYNSWINQKLNKTGADFKELFLNIFNTDDTVMRRYDNIENIIIDEQKLRHLLNILLYTLESNVTYNNSDPNKIQIIGKFICLSNIPIEILSTKRKNIEIFASNKIFIDSNINFFGKEKNIIIAANEWNVINTKIINLNGIDGLPHIQLKANDGEGFGCNGANGFNGLPGGSAGSFFGIGRKFINTESLTITACGGNGGPGQDGGNGTEGINGDDPFVPPNPIRTTSSEQQLNAHNLKFSKIIDKNSEIVKQLNLVVGSANEEFFKVFGTTGGSGGNGGNGGIGGFGGLKGKIIIIDLKDSTKRFENFICENEMGKIGDNGCGGDGGLGGYNGKCIVAKYQNFQIPPIIKAGAIAVAPETAPILFVADYVLPVKWTIISEECQDRCNSGESGLISNMAIMDNTDESYVKIESISQIVDDYKTFLVENITDAIMKKCHAEFTSKLDATAINNISLSF